MYKILARSELELFGSSVNFITFETCNTLKLETQIGQKLSVFEEEYECVAFGNCLLLIFFLDKSTLVFTNKLLQKNCKDIF